MIPLALILLAATTHVDVVDEIVVVPAGEWRPIQLGLRQRPAIMAAEFELPADSPEVRLLLMRQEDLERLRDQQPSGVLAATAPGPSGRMRYHIRVPGDYVVVIDNRASQQRSAAAHLRVSLDFGARIEPQVMHLSLGRQLAVITISFAVFFAIVSYSARRLLRGIRR